MHFLYLDEVKNQPDQKYFLLSGIILNDYNIQAIERDIYKDFKKEIFFNEEFHGEEIFRGKKDFKGIPIADRIKIFEKFVDIAIKHKISILVSKIDVEKHNRIYSQPENPYKLTMMIILERFSTALKTSNSKGLIFADIEKDESDKMVKNFFKYKVQGTDYKYQEIDNLIDTIYYVDSKHSIFIQFSDVLTYMIGRYETKSAKTNAWHEQELKKIYEKLKKENLIKIFNFN